mgnify:CR=1 FL=1
MPKRTRTSRLLAIGSLAFALLQTACAQPELSTERSAPNLIVIMADDLGYADVGLNGGTEIPTPHIDQLAAEGVNFTDAYASYSVCGPSRAGFITGRYQQRFGFERNPAWKPSDPSVGVPLEETTLAEALRPLGYTSAIIGKWHLGAHENHHPLNRGFDEFFGHLGGGHRYFPDELYISDYREARNEPESYVTMIMRDHEAVPTTRYLTDEFTHEALEFIRRQEADAPFFLFLSYNAPHAPLQAPDDVIAQFSHVKDKKRRIYSAMVTVLDQGVGQIMELLDELELNEDTLVVFLSDNGGPTRSNASDNAPLRGTKSMPFEGGFRVPFAARWPGVIPAGTSFGEPVSSLDIFATIAALNGIEAAPERPLDGVNLIPYVRGEKSGTPHPQIYLRMFDTNAMAYREGDFKILSPKRSDVVRLFNVEADISESRNLAATNPERVKAMLEDYQKWDAQLIEPIFQGLNMEDWKNPKVRTRSHFD